MPCPLSTALALRAKRAPKASPHVSRRCDPIIFALSGNFGSLQPNPMHSCGPSSISPRRNHGRAPDPSFPMKHREIHWSIDPRLMKHITKSLQHDSVSDRFVQPQHSASGQRVSTGRPDTERVLPSECRGGSAQCTIRDLGGECPDIPPPVSINTSSPRKHNGSTAVALAILPVGRDALSRTP